MKRFVLLTMLASLLPLGMMAQDDVYFTPSKETKANVQKDSYSDDTPTYYSGSNRNVDEYNRRGKLSSYYQKIGSDSLGNDIIEFHAGNGKYPDSLSVDTIYPGSQQYYYDDDDDFAYSRRMSRFDDYYGWYDPYFYGWAGYGPYWGAHWGWYDPWFYDDLFWGYNGWYDPWYYGYGWGRPYWGWDYWGPGYAWHGGNIHRGPNGRVFRDGQPARNWSNGNRSFGNGTNNGTRSFGNGGFGNSTRTFGNNGGRSFGNSTYQNGNRSFGNSTATRSYTPSRIINNGNRSFGSPSAGSRSFGSPSAGSRSFGGSSSFGGGRSFGGGSFGGGGRSFGGGGGGRSFGGHR